MTARASRRPGCPAVARAARLGVSLLAVLCIAWGCTGRRAGEPTALRIAVEADPATLDPALSVDLHSGRVVPLIAPGLVRFDRDLRLAPSLAVEWRVEEEGRAYHITLREGATFSDGTPVTADLVKASFERVLAPATRSPRDWLFRRIEGAEAFRAGAASDVSGIVVHDERHLTIRLDAPFVPFLSFLAMPQAAVLPRALLVDPASPIGDRLAGAGAWQLASWGHDDRVVLSANSRHWHPPRAERLEVRIIPKPQMQMLDFEAGQLDIVQIPEADLRRVREAPPAGARIVSATDLAVYYIGLNNEHPPLRDARVRRALNLAVNTEVLFAALEGGGVRARGAIPPGLGGHDSTRAPYPFLPDSARALLREAGFPDGFDLTVLAREGSRFGRSLLGVQADLAAIGVRLSIANREWGTLKQTIDNGQAEAFLADWYADYPDGENFLFPLFHSRNIGGGGNRARYRDADVDRMIEEAQRETDAARREALYREIDARVHSDAPWIFLWHPQNHYLVRDDIEGFLPHPLFYGEDFTSIARRAR